MDTAKESKPVVPCYECICVPICRNKHFISILQDCEMLSYFYYNESYGVDMEDYTKKITSIKIALKTERLRA